MTIDEATQNIGSLVRISPKINKNTNFSSHWGRGKITGVTKHKVIVHPFPRHNDDIVVDPKFIKLWGKNEAVVSR